MEALLVLILVGFVVFVVAGFVAFRVGRARALREAAAFQDYVASHFPDVPAPVEMLCTARQSRGKPDIALVVAEPRGEILVLLDEGPQGIRHLAYPFGALTGVHSTSQILSRGLPTSRIYSYEQTMTVSFADGSSIPFVLETISNRHGSDHAPAELAAIFGPWEQRLDAAMKQAHGGRVPF